MTFDEDEEEDIGAGGDGVIKSSGDSVHEFDDADGGVGNCVGARIGDRGRFEDEAGKLRDVEGTLEAILEIEVELGIGRPGGGESNNSKQNKANKRIYVSIRLNDNISPLSHCIAY